MSDPFRIVSARRLPPLPGAASQTSCRARRSNPRLEQLNANASANAGLTPDLVKTYLAGNRHVLEEFVMEYVRVEELDEWLKRKKSNSSNSRNDPTLVFNKEPEEQEKFSETDIVKLQGEIIGNLHEVEDYIPFMYEMLNVIGMAVKADGCTLYAVRSGGNELFMYIPPHNDSEYQLRVSWPVGLDSTVSAFVAKTKRTVLIKDLLGDDRFPRGIGIESNLSQSVLCAPVTLPSDDLLCVMELTRNWENLPFSRKHFQIVTAMVSWIGCNMYQVQVNKTLTKQAELNDFLLEVSKIIFDDIITLDSLVERIMSYTKELMQAERCTLFLVDKEKQELYSDLFDEGQVIDGKPVFVKKEEIRFPLNKGIAGHVARTGEVINIPDAYNDARFNREIDQKTGYTTHSILCMPIISKGEVIGVVQMINKKSGVAFTHADESSFKMFAIYCAMALYYSRIYTDIKWKTAQYKVALEQVGHHITCSEDGLKQLVAKPVPKEIPEHFESFQYYGPAEHGHILSELAIFMMRDLFGPESFDTKKLCHFLLTVKKNYRPVPYHNWNHAWNVMHCMYIILKKLQVCNPDFLSNLQMQAMIVAAACHDIDHRGYNNAFMTKFGEPLGQLYQTSVMEQHHFAHTVTILQQEDLNIFCHLSSSEYKKVLEVIRHAIISTDLALFFPNQKNLSKLVLSEALNINDSQHREMVTSLVMTAADLSAASKSWPSHKSSVKCIYEEFYEQGDMEKQRGKQPIPMMDRDKSEDLPKDQIWFLKNVCMPCYQTLSQIFPETEDLLHGVRDNLHQWERVVEGKSTSVWEPAKSWVKKEKKDNTG